jgi:hypothetical protein
MAISVFATPVPTAIATQMYSQAIMTQMMRAARNRARAIDQAIA